MELKIIGKKLKALRLTHGYTQQYVADMIYTSQSVYNRIENGDSMSIFKYIDKVASVFKVSVDEILNSNTPVHKKTPIDQAPIFDTITILVHRYEKTISDMEMSIRDHQNAIKNRDMEIESLKKSIIRT